MGNDLNSVDLLRGERSAPPKFKIEVIPEFAPTRGTVVGGRNEIMLLTILSYMVYWNQECEDQRGKDSNRSGT